MVHCLVICFLLVVMCDKCYLFAVSMRVYSLFVCSNGE